MAPAEIIEENDMTGPSDTGWKVYYKVRREDGEEITVDANCTDTVEVLARELKDPETMAFLGDRGRAAALKYAENARSAEQGGGIVKLTIDPLSGHLRPDYD